ncbi:MAG: hypothetical protein ACR2O6_01615 [Ilumatobacteraceae bacterium]
MGDPGMIARQKLARVAALFLMGASLVGAQCGVNDDTATLRIDPPITNVSPGTVFTVDVIADVTKGSLQAFELSIQTAISSFAVYNVLPNAEFDDDGALFLPVEFDHVAGTASRIVDLRHGEPLPTGEVRLATLQIFAHSAGAGSIDFAVASLAADGGAPVTVTPVSGTVTVAAP